MLSLCFPAHRESRRFAKIAGNCRRQTCLCHPREHLRASKKRLIEASAGFMRPLMERNDSGIRIQGAGAWAKMTGAGVSSFARCCNGIALNQDVGHDMVGNNLRVAVLALA